MAIMRRRYYTMLVALVLMGISTSSLALVNESLDLVGRIDIRELGMIGFLTLVVLILLGVIGFLARALCVLDQQKENASRALVDLVRETAATVAEANNEIRISREEARAHTDSFRDVGRSIVEAVASCKARRES